VEGGDEEVVVVVVADVVVEDDDAEEKFKDGVRFVIVLLRPVLIMSLLGEDSKSWNELMVGL